MASILKVDTIQDQSGNNIINESGDTITIGASGDTITVPTGASLTVPSGGLSGQNYPAFQVNRNNVSQSIPDSSSTKIQYTQRVFDTDSAFDITTNYRFVVPSGKAGKYYFYGQCRVDSSGDFSRWVSMIKKNGTTVSEVNIRNEDEESVTNSVIVDLADGDYVEHFVFQNFGSARTIFGDTSRTYFLGYRIGD